LKSSIDPSAKIHPFVWISPDNVVIEKGVNIEANSCIGAQALVAPREFILFGKKKLDESKGPAIIKEEAHIGPLNSIFLAHKEGSNTIIGKNVITGGNITIGHDVIIGEQSMIYANSMIAGYVKIGKRCRIGPSAVIRNRITIGDEAIVSMGSVVTRDVPPKKRVTGNFAIDHDSFIRNLKKSLE
jgi:UDP-3-O-[3-hydroxymyristoyl] glucosamine N-acyltransferase